MMKQRFKVLDVITMSFLVIFLLVCSGSRVQSQIPITLAVNNHWQLPEDEQVGTKVSRVRPSSESAHIRLQYSIEPEPFVGVDITPFFRIDNQSGDIYLEKPLSGLKTIQGYKPGQEFGLYIIGTDIEGESIAGRVGVRIQIGPRGTGGNNQPTHPLGGNFPKVPYPYFAIPPGAVTPPPPPQLGNNDISSINPFRPGGILPPTIGKGNFTSSSAGDSSKSINNGSTTKIPTTTNEPINNLSPESGSKEAGQDETNSNKNKDYGEDSNNYSDINDNSVEKQDPGAEKNHDSSNRTTANRNNKFHEDANNQSNDSEMMTLVTIIPIVVIFAIIPIIAVSMYLLKKRNRNKKRPTKEIRKDSAAVTSSSVTMSGEGESPSALTQWVGKRAQSNSYHSWDPDAVPPQTVNRWEFPRHHLQIGGILGEGCFGQVWRCEALNIDGHEGTYTVAVKTLKESAGDRERADLLSELAVMKMLDPHPNVVRLLGACTEKDPIFVIMEYVALGKLQSYLRNSRAQHYYGNLHADSSSLSSKDLTSFAHQVAKGMEYLASKGIIHRDLAARNVLIDKKRMCKVADFGFARDVVDNHVYERKSDGRLPIRWMAPEALYDNIFTTKTDVWSFGVLMWEIVTLGSTPYPGMAAGEVMRKVRDGYRLEKPEHCRRELYNIMFYCWAHNPDDRPTFSDLVNFLSHLLFSETDYIELDRFPDHDYYNMSSLSGEKL